jgi:hypothetical protein
MEAGVVGITILSWIYQQLYGVCGYRLHSQGVNEIHTKISIAQKVLFDPILKSLTSASVTTPCV